MTNCCRPYFLSQILFPDPPASPPEPGLCVQWVLFDSGLMLPGDTINGTDITQSGDTFQITYETWEGTTGTVSQVINGTIGEGGSFTGFWIAIYRPSDQAAFANAGQYVSQFDPGNPVTIEFTYENCTQNCYQAVFTVDALDNVVADIVVHNQSFDGAISTQAAFDDPDFDNVLHDLLVSLKMIEESATVEMTANGLEITLTICSLHFINSGTWWNGVDAPTSFNFTQL